MILKRITDEGFNESKHPVERLVSQLGKAEERIPDLEDRSF